MAKSESDGASGTINLYREWKESGSGHYERERAARLTADSPDSLMLLISHSESNMYKISESTDEEHKYRIGVQLLIQLISQHGEAVK